MNQDNECTIRELQPDETELLKDFLYEAIFVPEGAAPPRRDIVNEPQLRVYTDDFASRRADNCLIAQVNSKPIGAVWSRIMDDYGHVDDMTPSLAISLYKQYRRQGIGTRLMRSMLDVLKTQGYRHVSLAVQKANYAVRLYEKLGFETVAENAEEFIMVCTL